MSSYRPIFLIVLCLYLPFILGMDVRVNKRSVSSSRQNSTGMSVEEKLYMAIDGSPSYCEVPVRSGNAIAIALVQKTEGQLREERLQERGFIEDALVLIQQGVGQNNVRQLTANAIFACAFSKAAIAQNAFALKLLAPLVPTESIEEMLHRAIKTSCCKKAVGAGNSSVRAFVRKDESQLRKDWQQRRKRLQDSIAATKDEVYDDDNQMLEAFQQQRTHIKDLIAAIKDKVEQGQIAQQAVDLVFSRAFTTAISAQNDYALQLLAPLMTAEKRHAELELMIADASSKENLDPLYYLIKQGSVEFATTETQEFLLLRACQVGHLNLALFLLEQGVNPNARKENGGYLSIAVCSNLGICKALIAKGADVNAKDDAGVTALHLAVIAGYFDEVSYLLTVPGLEINAQTKFGITALMHAAITGKRRIVEALSLAPGIDLNCVAEGGTAFQWSVCYKQAEIASFLASLRGITITSVDSQGRSLFLVAVSNDSVDMIKTLAAIPLITVNDIDADGDTPLHYALKSRKKLEVVSALLRIERLNVDIPDKDGSTPLHWVIENAHTLAIDDLDAFLPANHGNFYNLESIAQQLILRSQCNSVDRNGQTPLMKAVLRGSLNLVQLLCEKTDINLDARDSTGNTVFGLAAFNSSMDIVFYLLPMAGEHLKEFIDLIVASGRVNAMNSQGKTILIWAVESGNKNVVWHLMRHAAPKDPSESLVFAPKVDVECRYGGLTPLILAVQASNLDLCSCLVPYCDVANADGQGKNGLMYAAEKGDLELCWLLAPHVNVKAVDNAGKTALMYAAEQGRAEVCEFLAPLSNVNHQAASGDRAFIVAAKQGHAATVRVLMEKHAKIDATTALRPAVAGDTAVHWALRQGHIAVAQMILEHVDACGKSALEFLKCMKRLSGSGNIPQFLYTHRNKVILPYLDFDCLPESVCALLAMKNGEGKSVEDCFWTRFPRHLAEHPYDSRNPSQAHLEFFALHRKMSAWKDEQFRRQQIHAERIWIEQRQQWVATAKKLFGVCAVLAAAGLFMRSRFTKSKRASKMDRKIERVTSEAANRASEALQAEPRKPVRHLSKIHSKSLDVVPAEA